MVDPRLKHSGVASESLLIHKTLNKNRVSYRKDTKGCVTDLAGMTNKGKLL